MKFPRWMNLDWLLPFKPQPPFRPYESASEFVRLQDVSRRLWLIDNRQESLRAEIAAARKAKKKHSHLLAEMESLTRERLQIERGGGGGGSKPIIGNENRGWVGSTKNADGSIDFVVVGSGGGTTERMRVEQ